MKLTNLFSQESVAVSLLLDRGAIFMCVTEEVALHLGFDLTEVSQRMVTLGDGHHRKVPKIVPNGIAIENRTYVTEAVVLDCAKCAPLFGLAFPL